MQSAEIFNRKVEHMAAGPAHRNKVRKIFKGWLLLRVLSSKIGKIYFERISKMKRMWINQPSTQQPHHTLHGVNVLIDHAESNFEHSVKAYFLSGPVVSSEILKLSLSPGWRQ